MYTQTNAFIHIRDVVLKLFYGSYAELFLEEIEKRLSGLKFPADYNELAIRTKNGDRAWAIASSETIVFDGKNSGVVFLTDITTQKRKDSKGFMKYLGK